MSSIPAGYLRCVGGGSGTASTTFTPSCSNCHYLIGFAVRNEPQMTAIWDISVTAAGSTTNLLPDFALNSCQMHKTPPDASGNNGAVGGWGGRADGSYQWNDYTQGTYDGIFASFAGATWGTVYTVTFSYNTYTAAANSGVMLSVYASAFSNNQNAPWGSGLTAFNTNLDFYNNPKGIRGACY